MSEFNSISEELQQDATSKDTEEIVQEPEATVQETEVAVQEPESSDGEDETEVKEPEAVEKDAEPQAETSEDDAEASIPKVNGTPYHERYYLKYRQAKRSTALDLAGTKSFLTDIGFDGGELRKAREGKKESEAFRNIEGNKINQMYCSYCGSEIAGVEFYRMPDGRLRCMTCSGSVVKTKAEVEEICKRVITNMDSFFGATIDVPVSISVVEERKIKRKMGVPLDRPDSQSILILGVAFNKKKNYSIVLENGAPRISLIATFAHELTHIWQYTHWDENKNLKKCSGDKRLLIYEGMAKWVEIQYLYLIGETNVAKREEFIARNRKDEYGVGFCLYDDSYPLSRDVMNCENTPFTPDRYPF